MENSVIARLHAIPDLCDFFCGVTQKIFRKKNVSGIQYFFFFFDSFDFQNTFLCFP